MLRKQEMGFEDSSNKPTFIIHLGPSKTGTTALQCALVFAFTKYQDRRHFLNRISILIELSWPTKCSLFFISLLSVHIYIRSFGSVNLTATAVPLSEVITLEAALQDFMSQPSSKASEVTTSAKAFHSNNTIHTTAKMRDMGLKNSSNKPTFIIHLGPSKTGTTALQCALIFAFTKYEDRCHFESDQYTYIGTLPNECRISVKRHIKDGSLSITQNNYFYSTARESGSTYRHGERRIWMTVTSIEVKLAVCSTILLRRAKSKW